MRDSEVVIFPILCSDKKDLVRDHMAIRSNLRILKLPRQRKTVTWRKYHDIQICEFSNDLENLSALQNPFHDIFIYQQFVVSSVSYAQMCADLVLPCGALQYTI
jgi:hypothetical protein